jgi:predicted phage-related endonuclease
MKQATVEDVPGLIVLSTGENREEWLEDRKLFYTATQASAIAGSHPYAKMIDVWNEKTDPNYDREANRNKWLDERAELGVSREPEILAWASADPKTGGKGAPFLANRMLLATPEALERNEAATPDGLKWVGRGSSRKLILLEAKATQQEWDVKGIPQHIYDQVQWQYRVTGAFTVWLAVEVWAWVGTGKNKHPEFLRNFVVRIDPDERRQEFLAAEVAKFDAWLREGIAPESDVDLREDDDEEARHIVALLDELAEITDRIKEDTDRMAEIKAELSAEVKTYEGRRIHLIGRRFIAKLVRFNKSNVDTSKLEPEVLRSITTWSESERVSYDPNPEYTTTESE